MRPTISEQTSAARHALSIIRRTEAMGRPALDWLEAAVETLAYIERQPEFARALAVILSALPGIEVIGLRETGHGTDTADRVGAVRSRGDAHE